MKIEFKKFDYIIMGTVVLLALLATIIFVGKHKIAKTPVISENTVAFQVFFRGVTSTATTPVFNPLDDTFITIRNVPHKKVTIIASEQLPRYTTVIDAKGKAHVVKDAASPNMYDCLVTLYDDAKVTEDGVVVGGNKLKIGLPIILEGKNYRFTGSLSNLQVLSLEEAKALKDEVERRKEQLNK